MSEPYYPNLSPVKTGLAGSCPRCGRGKLFSGYLTVAPSCTNCGLSYAFADAGDGAAWFVMLATCIVGVGGLLGLEAAYSPPFWMHALVAIPVLIIAPLLLLRPVKGVLLCLQYKTQAEEGRLKSG